MLTKTVEIEVGELTVGMYVAQLDRPWLETPFPFQGFRIKGPEEIEALRRLCKRVHIDITVGDDPKPKARRGKSQKEIGREPSNEIFRNPVRRVTEVKRPVEEEIASAKQVHGRLAEAVSDAMQELQSGSVLAIESIQAAARPFIDSVERNPDALGWLTLMRQKDTGIYRHALSAAVLVLTYGRHLGLPRPALESLALGGLLFDVGKIRISDTVLMKPDRLTDSEFKCYQQHVEHGIEILTQCHGVNDTVLSMVRTHHERHDGSGYPLGLKGDMIPAFGKIAGIADAYRTMLESSTAGKRLSAHDALTYLSRHRGLQFDEALVEEFIQAIGIYPTGTLVKLSDGCVGVVIEQNRMRRLLPKVMLVLDHAQRPLSAFQTVDLLMESSSSRPLHIAECLEPGTYGIDPEEIFL